MRTITLLVSALAVHQVAAYCNSMGSQGYGPRTNTMDFRPGWNGLARTPARGWRSWYAYYTAMNEGMIKEAIDALAAKNRTVKGWDGKVSLCDLGYCMAGIDEGWEGCGQGVNGTQHFVNGTPAANPVTFPDMKGLVDYGHAKNVKMGWYFNGCGCIEKRKPESRWGINYEGDIERLAEFGFDGVKFDGCGRMCNMTFYADLMDKTGKAFAIENCHWGDCTTDDASSCPTKDWCPFNWFRTSGDSNNALGTWYSNLHSSLPYRDWDEPLSQPGCWAYPDMLQVGRLGCPTKTHGCAPSTPQLLNWTRTHYASFAIASSPLVLSIHPSDANLDPILDIIGNKLAMEINQAWAGHPGGVAKTLPPSAPPAPPIAAGDHVVGVSCDKADTTEGGFAYDAAAKHITRGGKCLGTNLGWGAPLTFDECGAKGFYQSYTFNAKTQQYQSTAPANGPVSPCCLEANGPNEGSTPTEVKVYRCSTLPTQQWKTDATTGTISTTTTGICLAARDAFTPPAKGIAGVQIWSKPLGNNRWAALFINGGGDYPSYPINLQDLNITTADTPADVAAAVTVTDVWSGEDAGAVVNGAWSTGVVTSLNSRFVVFEKPAAAPTTADAVEGAGDGDAVSKAEF